MDKQRQEFEDWFSCNSTHDHMYIRGERMDEEGGYYSEYAHLAWLAWQQAQKSAVPDNLVLDKPAKVANGNFGIGVKWSTVIGAAQRQFEYAQNNISETTNIQDLKGILFDVPEGFVLVPREPSAEIVNHGHAVFLGHFNEGGQTGGQSLYYAYKAMIEAQEQMG